MYADLHFYNSLYTPTFCSVLFSIYFLFCLTIAGLRLPLTKEIQERKDNLINRQTAAERGCALRAIFIRLLRK